VKGSSILAEIPLHLPWSKKRI